MECSWPLNDSPIKRKLSRARGIAGIQVFGKLRWALGTHVLNRDSIEADMRDIDSGGCWRRCCYSREIIS